VDLTVVEWVRHGRWLGAIGRASGWWIGDWLRYGNARYGDRYGPAARVTGYDLQSLRNMAYVAGRFNPRRRRDRLSFSHHAELASLPTPEQDVWLDRAEASRLSVHGLRSELRRTRRRAASRATLAEARRKRIEALTSVRPNTATFDREATSTPASDAPIELVCPRCGCHFGGPADHASPSTRSKLHQP
jgi:hypothetical protein